MINFVLKLSFFRNQAHKLGILLLCTIISIMIAILVTVPQTTGYELSIYDAYPIYFWVLLMCSITCGIIILVQQAFSEKRSRLWAVGFFVIIFTNLIILLLPVIRGYVVLGRGDVLTHIGYIKEILYTAHFSSNFYPAIHILTATLSSMTGLTPELLAELVPVTFTVFYMISVYIFARAFSSHRGQVLLIAAFGCLLLFRHENIMLAPSVQCFYMLPFVLFLFLKAQTSTKRQCHFLTLIVSLSAIPFLHPGEGTIFLILTFLSFSLAIWFHRWNNHLKQIDLFSSLKHLPIFYTCLVLFTIWFIWFSYTSTFSEAIAYVWNQLLYPTNETTAMEYFTILDNGNLSIFKTIRIFLNMVGQVAIYCLVGSVVIIYLLKKFIFDRIKISFQQFNFAVLFIIFSVLLFIAFFST